MYQQPKGQTMTDPDWCWCLLFFPQFNLEIIPSWILHTGVHARVWRIPCRLFRQEHQLDLQWRSYIPSESTLLLQEETHQSFEGCVGSPVNSTGTQFFPTRRSRASCRDPILSQQVKLHWQGTLGSTMQKPDSSRSFSCRLYQKKHIGQSFDGTWKIQMVSWTSPVANPQLCSWHHEIEKGAWISRTSLPFGHSLQIGIQTIELEGHLGEKHPE